MPEQCLSSILFQHLCDKLLNPIGKGSPPRCVAVRSNDGESVVAR
jgi:hypothetical protein